MNIETQKITDFMALKPRYFDLLKSISLTRDVSQEGCSRYDIEIVLCQLEGNDQKLRINFINAFDIILNRLEGLPSLLVDIEDVSSMQLEGGKYRVVEQEERAFSFYCEDFFAELITTAE
ncbi:MAG: hypothetical protein NTV43_07710 [Methylococcales bacterium]|nr:hypothetical protein [Methylococcales bacterium]